MNVSAVRSVLADRCERDASLRAVFDFHRRTFAAKICRALFGISVPLPIRPITRSFVAPLRPFIDRNFDGLGLTQDRCSTFPMNTSNPLMRRRLPKFWSRVR